MAAAASKTASLFRGEANRADFGEQKQPAVARNQDELWSVASTLLKNTPQVVLFVLISSDGV